MFTRIKSWIKARDSATGPECVDPERLRVHIDITLCFDGKTTQSTGVTTTFVGRETFPEQPVDVFQHFEAWWENKNNDQDDVYVFVGNKFRLALRRQDIVMYQVDVL